jgi:hypothetical protein
MHRNYPAILFERYADDIIVHSQSERQALWLKTVVARRLAQCKLELHPERTKIVYCQDSDRTGSHPNVRFDFLGFGFRPRGAKSRLGRVFVSFLPAVSKKAANSMRSVIRGWRLHRLIPFRNQKTLNCRGESCIRPVRAGEHKVRPYKKVGVRLRFGISDENLLDLSRMFNPVIRGWINYYDSYYKSAFYGLADQFNRSLQSWAMWKYKRLPGRPRKAGH